ncbi:hypothetical protein GCM10027294_25810 [Marinactinospora endophytica]
MILPWASDNPCPHRRAALDWTVTRWRRAGHQVLIGQASGPWRKATAVANALPAAEEDVLVIADADCWTPGLDAAIDAVRAGAAWAMPHGRVHRLSERSTVDVLAGAEPHMRMPLTQQPYVGWPGGGIVVLRRDTYAAVPLDPRFVGWGQEDESWALALNVLAGPGWRGRAPLWHLYHPPQQRMSRRWGSPEARELAGRYRAARRDPTAMRALVGELSTLG